MKRNVFAKLVEEKCFAIFSCPTVRDREKRVDLFQDVTSGRNSRLLASDIIIRCGCATKKQRFQHVD